MLTAPIYKKRRRPRCASMTGSVFGDFFVCLSVAMALLLYVPSVSLCVLLCHHPHCFPSGSLDCHCCCPFLPFVHRVLLAVAARVIVGAVGRSLFVRTVWATFLVCAVIAGDRIPCITGRVVVCAARLTVVR